MLAAHEVALVRSSANYPEAAPFHPRSRWPEYTYDQLADRPNDAYDAVRRVFLLAGLDAARAETAAWNPLGELMVPGEVVLLKPNMVKESHPRDPDGWRYVLTHGSIIRAALDYVYKAVGPSGRVVIADAPQTDSSFNAIVSVLGLDVLQSFYGKHGLQLDLVDLRNEEWTAQRGVIVDRRTLQGDQRGTVAFNLGADSEFVSHGGAGHYYGADYDRQRMNAHHRDGRHEYLLSGSAMQADVVLSLPKLKTHKKAGVTLAMKNLIGVNADKNWLPHHTEGGISHGGDESPDRSLRHRIERAAVARLHRVATAAPSLGARLLQVGRAGGTPVFGDTESTVRSGNWYGNDTIWRTCLDINKIVAYGNPDGSLRTAEPGQRRRHLVLLDGLIAGQADGPMNPEPLEAGLVAFGTNAPSVDAAATYVFGFDPERIPIVRQAFATRRYPLTEWGWGEVSIRTDYEPWAGLLPGIDPAVTLRARAHFGWINHMELPQPV